MQFFFLFDYKLMQLTGHVDSHAPQSIHASVISYFPSASTIADTGHVPAHAPHAIHSSLFITYILLPPIFSMLIHNIL